MLLKQIELSGFKSFAKKSDFEFNTTISAIVGPNGSGKSNVAEAFRFVLGEQSMKSLRGKRGEDLIWNGGKDLPRSNRASVKVLFDNSKRFLEVDFDEVSIERVVHRDGINEYHINGSQVRLKDVLELLASAHIGSSGHHIISQGEADRILQSSPKDRRAIVEDALGLRVYQYKRQESERKLQKTENNIEKVESLRREIAPHLRFLKKQVDKIEKAKELREDLKTKALEYLKRESIYISFTENNLREKHEPLKEKKEKIEQELEKARLVLEQSSGADEKTENLVEKEKELQETRRKKDELLQELGNIEGQISAEERVIEREKERVAQIETKPIPLSDVVAFTDQISNELDQIQENDDISFIQSTIQKIKEKIRNFVESKKEEKNSIRAEEAKDILGVLKNKREEINHNFEEIKGKELEIRKSYDELKNQIETEKDTSRDAEKALFALRTELGAIDYELSQIGDKLEYLKHTEEDFKRELKESGILVGREMVTYEKFDLGVDEEEVAHESRDKQEERRRELEKIKIRVEDAGLAGGGEVIKEYEETSERDKFLESELIDLEKSAESLKSLIMELGEKLDKEFKFGIEKINKEFQNFFGLMFGGGNASLKVVKLPKRKLRDEILDEVDVEDMDEEPLDEDTDEEGIDIEVSLPRKKIKGLVMLSGGERALTSIALLFALSQVNPPPFIILDETDAALDEANSKKYGDMIENLSKYSQLILITHNRETMSRAGVIYGVTMDASGISKTLSIQFEEAVEVAK